MTKVGVGRRNAAIINGEEDLTKWSDTELQKGMRRDRNGSFTGRPPRIVPAAVHQELVRRQLSKAQSLLNESVVDAVLLLREVVKNEDADYGHRIKASSLIMDRVMGRAPEHITLSIDPPWALAIKQALVDAEMTGVISTGVIDVDSDDIESPFGEPELPPKDKQVYQQARARIRR
jgi:hypothetical protein